MPAPLIKYRNRLTELTTLVDRNVGMRFAKLQQGDKIDFLLRQGKGGAGGVGAVYPTQDEAVSILLAIGAGKADHAMKWVRWYESTEGEWLDGQTVTLRKALNFLLDVACAGRVIEDKDSKDNPVQLDVDRILFTHDEAWPSVEIAFRPISLDGERLPPCRLYNFTPAEAGKQRLGETSGAMAMDGGLITVFAELLNETE